MYCCNRYFYFQCTLRTERAGLFYQTTQWRFESSGIRCHVNCYMGANVSKKLVTSIFRRTRVRLKRDGTRWHTGGEVKGKLANGVCSQYSHVTSEHGVSSITTTDSHTSAASSRLNWRPRWLKWTRPFCQKTKSGFCACAITVQMQSTSKRSQQAPPT